jgi:hypothetical protein
MRIVFPLDSLKLKISVVVESEHRIKYNAIWLLGIGLLYWLPIFWTGAGWGRWEELPRRWSFQHAVAALFPNRQSAWSHPVYRVRTEKTGQEWVELDRWLMSEAEVAGYRHRVDRLISMAAKSKNVGSSIFAGLAEHAARRVEEARPELGRVTGFRVLTLIFPTNTPEMAQPKGLWRIPEPEELEPKRVALTVEVEINHGKAVAVKRRGQSRSQASEASEKVPGGPSKDQTKDANEVEEGDENES